MIKIIIGFITKKLKLYISLFNPKLIDHIFSKSVFIYYPFTINTHHT